MSKQHTVEIKVLYKICYICFNMFMKDKLRFKSPSSTPSLTSYILCLTTNMTDFIVYMQININYNTCIYGVTIRQRIIEKIKVFHYKWNRYCIKLSFASGNVFNKKYELKIKLLHKI